MQHNINANILAATRPTRASTCGLISIQMECPLFVWTEVLTHRRFARNASSARAMSTQRYTGMNYYYPVQFLRQGPGMQASTESIEDQQTAQDFWNSAIVAGELAASGLEHLGVAKEQRNRLIPPIKIVRGIVTGTEAAWRAFLQLRDSTEADSAMQILAALIASAIDDAAWDYAPMHFPYRPDEDELTLLERTHNVSRMQARLIANVARCARVSYAREKGKDDQALYSSLLSSGHMSPFEHVATWTHCPTMSCFTCTAHDVRITGPGTFPRCEYSGWQSYRAALESNTALVSFL